MRQKFSKISFQKKDGNAIKITKTNKNSMKENYFGTFFSYGKVI